MPWNGYKDDETDIGSGWEAIENCSFYIKGECRRRLGFGAKIDLSSAVVRAGGELGNYCLVGTAGGAVLSITQSSGAVASLATGLDTTNWPVFAPGNSRLYYTNGVDSVRVSDDGTGIRTAGITAPGTAATASTTGSGGVVTAGVHLVRYRYYDSTRNRLSDPSTAASVTITAGQKISAGHTTTADTNVDKIIIEITPAGAETYYRVTTINKATGSTTLDISDSNLILGIPASRDGDFQHQPPPVADILIEHNQRLWLWKITGGYLYWSRAFFPESWDSANYLRTVTLDGGDTPAAMISFYSDLYLVGQRSMKRLVYTEDPFEDATIYDVPGNLGAFNPRCVCKIDGGMVVGWGKNGAWILESLKPVKISKRIDATLAEIASTTALTQRFVCYEPIRREVAFVFPLTGSTTCKAAFVYSLDTQEWVLWKWRQGMTAGVMNTTYTDRARLAVFDENGYAWRVGVLANDGIASGVFTVTSGSTTTVINATNSAAVGMMLYRPSTGEERLITGATGSTITVAALSTAPTAGEKVYVGSIRQRLLTDWNAGSGMNQVKRPTKFIVAVRPSTTMGTGTIAYYQDFSDTAVTLTAFAADDFPDGIDVTTNDDSLTVDFDDGAGDGFFPAPTPSDWKRVIRAEIIADAPYDGVHFLEAAFRNDASAEAEET